MKWNDNEYDLYDPDWKFSDTIGVFKFFFWQIPIAVIYSIFFERNKR